MKFKEYILMEECGGDKTWASFYKTKTGSKVEIIKKYVALI